MSRVALYTRVSTSNGQDTTLQTNEIRAYCARRGWTVEAEYTDTASGAKEQRAGLLQLMADARRRKFSAVVVYRYDRFARSLRHLVNALGEFDALGIHFISLHEGVDTSTPNGRLVFGIFASIAEFERELIRSRVRSGMAAARAKGKRIGRPRVRADSRQIATLRGAGASWAAVCQQLNLSKGTAQRAYYSLPTTPLVRDAASSCASTARTR